jgi:hypothetical protein
MGQLRLRHLEREEGDRLAVLGGDVLGDVADQRRLAERWARRDDDEVPRLKATQLRVEVAEARRRPGDRLIALRELLETVDLVAQDLRDAPEVARALLVGDLEQQALGPLDELVRLPLPIVDRLLDALRSREQPAKERVLLDDLRVVASVAGDWDRRGKLRDRLLATGSASTGSPCS